MEGVLAPRWSFLLARGIASVAFGIIALAWPGVTLAMLTFLFGAYAFADGVITLVVAARHGKAPHLWLVVVDGLLGIGVGIATAVWPAITLLVLVLLIGIRFFVAGVVQVASALAFRHELEMPFLYVIGGLASIAVGILTFAMPGVTAKAIVMFLGIYALVFGVSMTVLAFRVRRVRREVQERYA